MKRKLLILALLFITGISFVAADEEHHHEMTAEQLGSVSFPVSCESNLQKQFERGVAWLYSFEYEQAEQEFKEVAKTDPKCAMAYWGQAMSIYHQLWTRPTKDEIHRGAALLKQARDQNPKTQRERGYIDALAIFYSGDDEANYKKRVAEYSDAMDQLRQKNPQDREAAVFYALSLIAQVDGKDPELAKERKAVSILNEQLKGAPNHPGITHYIIHATDNPQLASMGLEAARAYARIAPASVHALHMPSHIFMRLGLWQDGIDSNLAALALAKKMEGSHTVHHQLHSMDFLLYGYLQMGDDTNAKKMVDAVPQLPKASMMPGYSDFYQMALIGFPATYSLERRQWKDALAISTDPSTPPYVQASAYWTRAIAAGHLKDAAAARAAADQVVKMIEATAKTDKAYMVEYMDTGRDEALAWALHAEGKDNEAVKLLRAAADRQDKVGKEETEMPAREMLADLLLESGHPKDALTEYEISLKTDPNRFNGLYGAAQAAEQSNQPEKAVQYYAQLLKNCSGHSSDRPELARAKTFAKVQ